MLDALSPEELVEMRAAYAVVPLPNSWKEAGTIAATVNNKIEKYFALKAGKRRIDKEALHGPSDYIPRIQKAKKPKVNQASIDLYQRMIESQFHV